MSKKIIIGSRGSDLALWQARYIKAKIEEAGTQAEIRIIKTKGDQIALQFDKMEGKGFFTREIEDALLNKEIDLAVHSYKDLESRQPEGLEVAAVTQRANPSEMLLIRLQAVDGKAMFSLKKNAVVGTSSARRKSQMLAFRPDIRIKDLRGNVHTRIKKLREGQYDAIILAAAGVERLELSLEDMHKVMLDVRQFIPAPAQGALAIEIRSEDLQLKEVLSALNHKETKMTTSVERKVLQLFDGGCQLPMGAHCTYDEEEDKFRLWVAKAERWDAMPLMFYGEGKDSFRLASQLVNKCSAIRPCSVFITRDISRNSVFTRILTAHGYSVEGFSLIDFVPVKQQTLPETDWIFFSSKHAVHFFFRQYTPPAGIQYGALARGTAETLRQYNQKASFIGQSTDTKISGKQFAAVAGRKKVLFPQAAGSLRSVQQQMTDQKKVADLIVYRTIQRTANKIPDSDIVLFTSPSNVQAWFSVQQWKQGMRAVAMGRATGKALSANGVRHFALPDSFDEPGLIRAVLSL